MKAAVVDLCRSESTLTKEVGSKLGSESTLTKETGSKLGSVCLMRSWKWKHFDERRWKEKQTWETF